MPTLTPQDFVSKWKRADGMWWIYTTTTQIPMSPAPRLVATAYDLPGNSNGKVWSDN